MRHPIRRWYKAVQALWVEEKEQKAPTSSTFGTKGCSAFLMGCWKPLDKTSSVEEAAGAKNHSLSTNDASKAWDPSSNGSPFTCEERKIHGAQDTTFRSLMSGRGGFPCLIHWTGFFASPWKAEKNFRSYLNPLMRLLKPGILVSMGVRLPMSKVRHMGSRIPGCRGPMGGGSGIFVVPLHSGGWCSLQSLFPWFSLYSIKLGTSLLIGGGGTKTPSQWDI